MFVTSLFYDVGFICYGFLFLFQRAIVKTDRMVLEELGFDKHIKDWSKFHGMLMPIVARYRNDQEVCS